MPSTCFNSLCFIHEAIVCWIIGQQTIAERNWRSIRMYILMLDTRNEEQTNDVRMYIEEYLF